MATSNPLLWDVLFWKRYIDDVLLTWTGSETDLFLFRDYINNTNLNLKFTMEYSQTKIHLLDLLISVNDEGALNTYIFRKLADKNTILHVDNDHPKHLIKNIPYGQFVRIKRICSDTSGFKIEAKDMQAHFRS